MTRITLDQANTIIAAAFARGVELGLKPLSVVVLDPGGHPIAFQRQDGGSSLRYAIATAKAGGALALGVSSRTIGEMAVERPTFIAALGPIAPTGVVPAAGGVIVRDGASAASTGSMRIARASAARIRARSTRPWLPGGGSRS